jgi:hypothetical protein
MGDPLKLFSLTQKPTVPADPGGRREKHGVTTPLLQHPDAGADKPQDADIAQKNRLGDILAQLLISSPSTSSGTGSARNPGQCLSLSFRGAEGDEESSVNTG